MANAYITLENSNASLTKKFAVIYPGYNRKKSKPTKFDKTIGGGLDYTAGAIYQQYEFVIRVRATEDRAGYGDKDDLETFFDLNNPSATPSNIITMTDHFDVNHDVLMIGSFDEKVLGVSIVGLYAWFTVMCNFQEIP